jgi:hypothetical protein
LAGLKKFFRRPAASTPESLTAEMFTFTLASLRSFLRKERREANY